MCGRYSQTKGLDRLRERFGFRSDLTSLPPRDNLCPGQEAPVIVSAAGRDLRLMRWGLVPPMGIGAIGARLINARAETLGRKPSFRAAFERRRCLVPADGFYEWQPASGGSRRKTPVRVVLKNGEPFAMAGLWEAWRRPDGSELYSFTIVTTEANDLLRPVHDRMPVVLRPDEEDRWLDPAMREAARLQPFLTPYPAEEMDWYPVSPVVNDPRRDSQECMHPASF
ncbi:MAG: SOS response-associated peptidase [Nitrospirae bacterium]|nr:SOS response-associated peptidase [Nitrospirota bacterium]